ncbi:MAG: aminomethyl-transferring glycine dehydrogenase subunit GcvPA [Deltaproteobacteria bacterium]|nr:aminomethyl-transferring glycine dehydrogenase subunit GcvPA [Deltaproteobacteria bacterium]MBW2283456.1 aminomethyl-transferring glycine dehydrogenase subunit GcvPA [Deltaproteobacteria bacterium]
MRYLPHTGEDVAGMLKAVGAGSLDDLFSMIPEACRHDGALDLPGPLTEWDLGERLEEMAARMAAPPEFKVFLGAGSYEHRIPAIVPYLLGRSEFVTAYTPYQPEISQGTLQAIYEYQTLTARLLGMEVANASLYDGASALAEALLMAVRITRRRKVAVSSLVHPHFRQVVRTYLAPTECEIVELPRGADGVTDPDALKGADDLAAVAMQSPNFLGRIEDLHGAGSAAHDGGALFVAAFTEPLAYGLLKNPGSQGADIACGEGQSLGIPQSLGGPALGMFAGRMKHVRSMPGRLVGRTTDLDGRDGFVLTLATREQHIRREKATSNICTNNSLCALGSAMVMASLGSGGIRELARLNRDKAEYLKGELNKAGFEIPFTGPTFNEFVVKFPKGFDKTYARLKEKKIIAGLPLGRYYPDLERCWLLCATETKTRADMDALVREASS